MKRKISFLIFISFISILFINLKSTYTVGMDKPCSNPIDNPYGYKCIEILDENGKVPADAAYNSSYSKGIKTLKGYNGKVFLGLGDYGTNTGPVKILYYDTKTGKMDSSGTIDDEEVANFNIIDGKLYTTGTDPWAKSENYGGYYIYNEETDFWESHMFVNGWIHVFDIVKYNEKLFMSGAVDLEKSGNPIYSMIQSSSDNGITFDNVDVYHKDKKISEYDPYKSVLRFYRMAVFNNELYAFLIAITQPQTGLNVSIYDGIYKYDAENNRFDFINHLTCSTTELDENLKCVHMTYETFDNYFLYNTGEFIRKVDDVSKITEKEFNIKNLNKPFAGIVVDENKAYILKYGASQTGGYKAEIYSTQDFETYDLVYSFNLNSLPYAFTYYDNSFYIGTNTNTSGNIGHLYRIGTWNEYEIDTENTVQITINKNDEPWQVSQINIALYSNGDLKYKMNSAYSSTITFSNVKSGTYDIYASKGNYRYKAVGSTNEVNGLFEMVDTGIDVTVDLTGQATINYYDLNYGYETMDNMYMTVYGEGAYLKNQIANVGAFWANNGYEVEWKTDSSSNMKEKEFNNNVNDAFSEILITKQTNLTAKLKEIVLEVVINKDGVPWNSRDVVVKLKKSDELINPTGYNNATYRFSKVNNKSYYEIYASISNNEKNNLVSTGKYVNVDGSTNITLDYYELIIDKGIGISTVEGQGIYLGKQKLDETSPGAGMWATKYKININSVAKSNYIWSNWETIEGNNPIDRNNNETQIYLEQRTKLLANAIYDTSNLKNIVKINIKKNNQEWNNSDINIALYSNNKIKYDYSSSIKSSSEVIWKDVIAGTYDVYASKDYKNKTILVDTGIDIIVNDCGETTIDYYELIIEKGIGISSVIGDGIYLNNQNVIITATVSNNYNWYQWKVKEGNTPKNILEKNTEVIITQKTILSANTINNQVMINIKKNDLLWKNSGINVALYMNGIEKYKYSDSIVSETTVLWNDVSTGTYDIYATKNYNNKTILVDTGLDIIANSDGEITIDYYELKLDKDIGISKVEGEGIYLKNQTININASINDGYIWSKWESKTGNIPNNNQNKNTSIKISQNTQLIANTANNEAIININKNDSHWDNSEMNISLYVGGIEKYKYTDSIISNSTVSWNKVAKGTYDVYAGKDSNNKTKLVDTGIDLVVNVNGYAQIDYYELKIKKDIGISTISEGGTYLKNQVIHISANTLNDYIWNKWLVNYGNIPSNVGEKTTSIVLNKPTELLATTSTKNNNDLKDYEFAKDMNIDENNKYIKYINKDTTVNQLISKITINNKKINLKVLNVNNVEKQNDNILFTGDKLLIYEDSIEKTKYDISILGDTNGDGKINSIDLIHMRKHIIGWVDPIENIKQTKTGIYYYSLDLNNDNVVNSIDLIRLRKKIIGNIS